jgi:hypothetical protein
MALSAEDTSANTQATCAWAGAARLAHQPGGKLPLDRLSMRAEGGGDKNFGTASLRPPGPSVRAPDDRDGASENFVLLAAAARLKLIAPNRCDPARPRTHRRASQKEKPPTEAEGKVLLLDRAPAYERRCLASNDEASPH